MPDRLPPYSAVAAATEAIGAIRSAPPEIAASLLALCLSSAYERGMIDGMHRADATIRDTISTIRGLLAVDDDEAKERHDA